METAQITRPIHEAAAEFLDNQRIAVTGVSRNPQGRLEVVSGWRLSSRHRDQTRKGRGNPA